MLEDDFEIEDVASRIEAVDLIRDVGDFDVAIVDIRSAANGSRDPLSGPETIRQIGKAEPSLGIVAYGERPERHLATAALQAGACSYVSRSAEADQLREAVMAAVEKESFVDPAVPPMGRRGKLTGRQREILQLLADGESTTIAARRLELSEETVKTHMKNILARLAARNRPHAVAIALRESLIE